MQALGLGCGGEKREADWVGDERQKEREEEARERENEEEEEAEEEEEEEEDAKENAVGGTSCEWLAVSVTVSLRC